jgi:ElaB/YqjD/DUF883 family membrane-anchored ribosome-binding protein
MVHSGKDPILFFSGGANNRCMRHKSGNGHNIDLDQFLADIKTVVQDGEKLLKAGVSGVKEKTLAGAQSTDRLVRNYPYQTLGIVFGLGLIAGLIASNSFGRTTSEED